MFYTGVYVISKQQCQEGDMFIRYLKIDLATIIALLCLVYAGQNVVNLEAAYQSFAYVMGNVDHAVYTSSFGPSITSPALIWLALIVVVACEFIAGFLAAKGAWDMWSARSAGGEIFNKAKYFALLGCGLGIIVWLGFFGVVGGAFFQMWQTTIGGNSLNGAFQFFVSCAIVFIIINMPDE